ncbi:MAG: Mrp/NBP35 family ATP-binding protein [Bacteroidales bacterium]|nr:Mrp/NBP35 family ATP-binding protein [Bacteroidales bacterium]
MSYTKEKIIESLRKVLYFPKGTNVVDLDMVDRLTIEGNKVSLALVYPQANDKNAHIVKDAALRTLKADLGENAEISIDTMSEQEAGRGPLGKVKNIIAVASGKGGVGKSTVAANLAIALAKTGAKVGLLDADIYGPSMPIMFGLKTERPGAKEVDGKTKILPIEKYGIKMLSIGFFIEENKALMWRGSMASNALGQLFNDAVWGELDFMVLDLPPGTGDIHLTLVQSVPVTGAVIVTTPQNVALADVRKAADMFKNESIKVPILGVVENMSYFAPEDCPDKKYYIFGQGGGQLVANELGCELLGSLPIVEAIAQTGDSGAPIALDDSTASAAAFKAIAVKVVANVEKRNAEIAATRIVQIDPNASCATN